MMKPKNMVRPRLSGLVLICLLISLSILLLIPAEVRANRINSIDIQAEILDDGSMLVVDRRSLEVTEGTEHYISLGRLGPTEVVSFRVFEQGSELEDIGAWNVNRSLEEKAGKSGIVHKDDGYELCFGVGSYGEHEFEMVYQLSNVVRNLTDGGQALYWQFIQPNMSTPIDSISIRVTNGNSFVFTQANTKIWGFGFKGQTAIESDQLLMYTEGKYNTSDYMVMLAIFPDAPFKADSSWDKTAEALEKEAKRGSIWEDEGEGGDNMSLILLIIYCLIIIMVLVIAINALWTHMQRKRAYKPSRKVDYYRDIPVEEDFANYYALFKPEFKNFLEALFLRWLRQGYLIHNRQDQNTSRHKQKNSLRVNYDIDPNFGSARERTLWHLVTASADEEGFIKSKELNRYIKDAYEDFDDCRTNLAFGSSNKLLDNGLLEERDLRFLFFKNSSLVPTQSGKELIDRYAGFRKYLLDFSLLPERSAYNVFLWDDYLIWAAYMGIADKVRKQLKLVNPEYQRQSYLNDQTMAISHYYASSVITSVDKAKAAASSGSGGSSSSGGGETSAGSSSGGGIR
ncbi:MAG: DUF2207 domain-containing protein [Eubacteriales bacterium]|nr:DUF2207 domain-containing protein [Eubacteriales bacterium]